MFTAISNFFRAPHYEGDPDRTQDVRTTHRIAAVLLLLGLLSIPFILGLETPTREYTIFGTVFGLFVWLFTIYMIKRGWVIPAKIIILTINTTNLLSVIYFVGGLERPTIFATLFIVALATLLFPKRGALVYGTILLVLSIGLFLLGRIVQSPEPAYSLTDRTILSIFIFTLIAVSTLLEIVSANMRQTLQNAFQVQNQLRERNLELDELKGLLEVRVEERTRDLENRTGQLKTIADLARSIATIHEVNRLFPEITRLVSERFNFYHVGIFLLDENKQFAILRAANSEGGQNMLKRGHRLQVGKQGIVGYVTSRGQARVALDVGDEAVYFDNPDLPKTHSEVALPLIFGREIIGALDIQSTETNAFSQEDVETFSILADQISVAIQNAQSLDQAQRALQEADRATKQLTAQAWKAHTQVARIKGVHFDGSNTRRLADTANTNEEGSLRIPIQIRGLEVASLRITAPNPDYHWPEIEIAMAQATAERTALALENARLLEDAQKRAAKERTISEGATRVSAALDVENILRATAKELERALGSSEVVILLEGEE